MPVVGTRLLGVWNNWGVRKKRLKCISDRLPPKRQGIGFEPDCSANSIEVQVKFARLFRLWGKKRGHRMTGWWFVGSLGEAAFFGILCLVGILALTTIIAWQVFSPETNAFPVGLGFWVIVIASASLIAIGGVGFVIRILWVATSDEHRQFLAGQAKQIQQPLPGKGPSMSAIPSLQNFTDSPGVKLAFRLPGSRPEIAPLWLSSLFALAWNALTAILIAIGVGSLRQRIDWTLVLVLPFFIAVGVFATRWFLINFRRATGIGITTVEISHLPLVAGKMYQLYVAQYGRLAMRKLKIALVCEESATYHHGTDVRTERHIVSRIDLLEHGRSRIDYGRPLELECSFFVPTDAMHSFQSDHNAIHWKIVVEGEANRWPSYCRSFPVVVYPAAFQRQISTSLPS